MFGDLKGTPRAPVAERLAAGDDVLLEIDVQGALKVKREFPEAVLVFVKPPSPEELRRRLATRGTEIPDRPRAAAGRGGGRGGPGAGIRRGGGQRRPGASGGGGGWYPCGFPRRTIARR